MNWSVLRTSDAFARPMRLGIAAYRVKPCRAGSEFDQDRFIGTADLNCHKESPQNDFFRL